MKDLRVLRRYNTMMVVVITILILIVFGGAPASYGDTSLATSPGPKDQSWWRLGPPEEGGEISIKRSQSDDRSYRYLELDNNLKVLLISDPEADKSAASLNVNVGSFQNPEDREGLAHFLEHMLFLGTDKYPDAGAYQKFISEHGGQHNAYTSMEDTNYFFDVDAKYLFAALSRFSRFFVAPRFDKTYVERERNAVDSEYRLKLKDDGRREWDVFSEQVMPSHPLSKFSVGNLETLADREGDPVRADLLAFYEKYYSADLMTLVVLGRQSLGQLEVVVRGLFSSIPNKRAYLNRESTEGVVDENTLTLKTPLPFVLSIQPIKDQRSLSVAFPMPSVEAYWRTRPDVYWGHILGDESKDSLIAQLKQAGLANGLGTGMAFDTRQGASFIAQIELTSQGVDQKDLVLDQLFSWINVARNKGLRKWRFDELANIQHTRFRFLEKVAAPSYVRQLSSVMRHYPPAEVLQGPYLLSEFDEQVLSDFINQLKPANALVTLIAPEIEKTDRTSARYSAPYRTDSVDEKTRRRWRNSSSKRLALAPINDYLAKTYSLSGKGGASVNPIKLDSQNNTTIWHYADQQFGSPRGLFEARFSTPALDSCRDVAQAELYLALVKDALGDQTYQAGLAGLRYSLFRWSSGIGLSIDGYTDRQAVLLDQVLTGLIEAEWHDQDFERLQTALIRTLRNSRKQWPIRQLFAQMGPLMKGSCDDETLADQLELLRTKDMPAFLNKLYSEGHARFYTGGALSTEQSFAMAQATMATLKFGNMGDTALFENVVRLPEKLLTHTVEVDHLDRSVLLFVQGDEDTLAERAVMAMINTILEASFYTTMRTEKQLGYVVGARIMPMNRVPGLAFFIQSPHSSEKKLENEINIFLIDFEQELDALSEDDLLRFKAALLANIEEKPQNVREQAARHKESLYLGYDDFQFRKLLVEQIKAIDNNELAAAYQRLFIDGSRRLMVTTRQVSDKGSELKNRDLLNIVLEAGQLNFAYPE